MVIYWRTPCFEQFARRHSGSLKLGHSTPRPNFSWLMREKILFWTSGAPEPQLGPRPHPDLVRPRKNRSFFFRPAPSQPHAGSYHRPRRYSAAPPRRSPHLCCSSPPVLCCSSSPMVFPCSSSPSEVVPCSDELLGPCTRAPWTTPRVKGYARGREERGGVMVAGGEPSQPDLRLRSMRDDDIKYVGLRSSLRSRWRVSHRREWHREGRHHGEADGWW